jgi:uncharacterized protein
MLHRLPEYIDPLQFADKGGSVSGQMDLSKFDRLADLLFSDAGVVEISLFFSREGRIAKIEGQIKSVLELECQNCLASVPLQVDGDVKLGVVTSIDEANRLPENYEPLVISQEGKVLLKDVVEDELLLLLPSFPKHQHDCLSQALTTNNNNNLPIEEHSASKSPFSILAKIKIPESNNGSTKK